MPWMRTAFLTLALLFAASPARAQSGAAAAEALFQEGRALFDAGKFAEACPKLAESQRLDPGTGTLLALALCHEGEGKLASAWAEFTTVEGEARQAGRQDREKIAREHAAALRPRLSTLAIDVPAELAGTPGLEVRLDGAVMGPGTFGVAVPVDGGEHRLEASAPGKQPWSSVVSVARESAAARAVVAPLADAQPATTLQPTPAAAASAEAQGSPAPGSGSSLRVVGLVTAGAGIVALGVGSYLALDAKSSYTSAKDECDGSACPPGPYDDIQDARSQGTVATVFFALGGAALATGAVLWFVAPSGEEQGAGTGARVRVERVGLGPRGVALEGRF